MNLGLVGKSILFVVGGILVVAALAQLAAGGAWIDRRDSWASTFEHSAGLVLLVGLALAVPPLAFAFRDAVRDARGGRGGSP